MLIFLAVISLGISAFGLYTVNHNTHAITSDDTSSEIIIADSTQIASTTDKYIHIAGAVEKPGVYQIRDNMRLYEVVRLAGGLKSGVDMKYLSRVLNLSSQVTDGKLIYIPWDKDDLTSKTFQVTLPEILGDSPTSSNSVEVAVGAININSCTKDQLLSLDGIGEAYATKIISGRPYKDVADFTDRANIPTKTLEKLVSIISF